MRILIYANGGRSVDKYTVIIGRDVYGMSDNPRSPQGFNQYSHTIVGGEGYRGVGVGKKIAFEKLPDEVQIAISERILETEGEHLT